MHILGFSDPRATRVALVGGKAVGLAELTGVAGVKVPEGFVVSTAAYTEFLEHTGLCDLTAELDVLSHKLVAIGHADAAGPKRTRQHLQRALTEKANTLRARIADGEMPVGIAHAVQQGYERLSGMLGTKRLRVAVRSSATAEDLPDASFAGQHDTFLNVQGAPAVLSAVKRCWASLFSARAVSYRNKLRLQQRREIRHSGRPWARGRETPVAHSNVRMAVVVQRLIAPAVAGVGFDFDPSTGAPFTYLEVNYGLGESVVSGKRCRPEAWWYSAAAREIAGWDIGDKRAQVLSNERAGTRWGRVAKQDRKRFALSDGLAVRIGQAVDRIAAHFHKTRGYQHIDTEFVVDDTDTLHFVQARPKTSSAQGKPVAQAQGIPPNAACVLKAGICANPGVATGRIRVVASGADRHRLVAGDILVARSPDPAWTASLIKSAAVVTDFGGMLCHAAIIAREQNLPAIVGTVSATEDLREYDGRIAIVDGMNCSIHVVDARPAIRSVCRSKKSGPLEGTDLKAAARITCVPVLKLNGDEWMARPHFDAPRIVLDGEYYGAALLEKALGCRITRQFTKGADGIERLYVKFKDLEKVHRICSKMSLQRAERFLAARIEAVKAFDQLSSVLCASPADLQAVFVAYIKMIAHLQIRWNFKKGLNQRLSELQVRLGLLPDAVPVLFKARTHELKRECPAYSEADQAYRQLLVSCRPAAHCFDADTEEEILAGLERARPQLVAGLTSFAEGFLPNDSFDIRTSSHDVDEVVRRLKHDLLTRRPPPYEPTADRRLSEAHGWLSRNDRDCLRFRQTLDLSVRQALQTEREHWVRPRGLRRIRNTLKPYAKKLVKTGLLACEAHLFDLGMAGMLYSVGQAAAESDGCRWPATPAQAREALENRISDAARHNLQCASGSTAIAEK
ncbi:MAG: hypothetical protein JXR37_27455 [Kiritimatiellae bacterium]|nr:hypothetical protein [Kiritimatiellia bacterium]